MSTARTPAKQKTAPKLAPNEELNALLQEFSQLKGYGDAMRQQAEFTTNVIAELVLSRNSLQEISKRGGNGETLIHIGAGNYIRAELKGVNSVVVGIGANVSVEKSLESALTEVESRLKQGQEQAVVIQNQYSQVAARLQQLQARIDQLYAQLENAGQA